jgi:tetratricopeptide (TPR) repeat protein
LRPFALILILLLAWPVFPQTRRVEEDTSYNQLDDSQALFSVMAAITAGGFNADAQALGNHPLRKTLADYFAKQTLPSVDALRRYVRDHKPKNPALEFNQYLSFALLVKGPPSFDWANPNLPLPPEVSAIDDFGPVVAEFYKEANLAAIWKQVEPDYEREIARYTEPVSRALQLANSYLRNPSGTTQGRRFQIFIELLAPPNQVQRRGYLDDDLVVVTPAVDLPVEDIRHAYLHYIADPLVRRFSAEVKKKSSLGDYALASPLLSDEYKTNFIELATECFIKAIESRLARKPAMAEEAMREGYVLTPAFAELLAKYEAQDQAMRLYFPDLIAGLDMKKEEKRLDHIDFVSTRPERTIQVTAAAPPPPAPSGAAKTLDDAEQAYTARDLGKAKQLYLRVMQETDQKPLHAKAYYGLARIAVLEKDPETGDRLFRKVLELEPDGSTKSWSLLYLARLADSQGDREEAQNFYRQALAVKGAPDAVRQAAQKGIQEKEFK